VRIVLPICTWSPSRSSRRVTGLSFNKVPLLEPRSSISTTPLSTTNRAWRRDAFASLMTMSQPATRPTVIPLLTGTIRPSDNDK
jgi:hypothetical protein